MLIDRKNLRQKGFAASLFLSTALVTMAASSPAVAQVSEQQSIDAFSASQYHYCDAKLMADFWGESIWQAKAGIGARILLGSGDYIPGKLQASRDNGNQCNWSETGFGYEDAENIASLWGLSSVEEAKSKMAWLATMGDTGDINQVLGY